MSNPIFILELNEFNDEFLRLAIKMHALPHLEKVLNYNRSLYKTSDRYNSGYLEPWVQWASIHAGVSSKEHQAKNRDEMPEHFQMIWNKLAEEGFSSAVWGVINAPISQSDQIHCFTQDVWSKSESAYPKQLNRYLNLGRYVGQHLNRLSSWRASLRAHVLKFYLKRAKLNAQVAWDIFKAGLQSFGPKPFVFMAYHEHASVLKLLDMMKDKKPKVTFLCLNLLSYLEHHYWSQSDEFTPEMLFGLKHLDRLLGMIIDHNPEITFVMHNGLSQLNMNSEKGQYYYQPKHLYQFLIDMRIRFLSIDESIKPFWKMLFTCTDHCEETYQTLNQARLYGKPLFKIERSSSDKQLFVRLNVMDDISNSTFFEFGGEQYSFDKYFEKGELITGRRVPMGTVYSNQIVFPDHIFNHNFNRYLLNYLNPEKYPLPKRESEFKFEFEETLTVE
ncbi:MAG: hypothetical protein U1E78_04120 [Gammaproteobacteria bacterium]